MVSLYWNSPLVTLRFTSASSLTWKKKKNFVSKTFKTNNSFYLNGFEIYNGHFKSINMSNKHTDVHVPLLCNIIILNIKINCGLNRKITCQDLLVANMITDKIKFKAARIQLRQNFVFNCKSWTEKHRYIMFCYKNIFLKIQYLLLFDKLWHLIHR